MLLRFVPASGEHLDWEGAVWYCVCLAAEAGATRWPHGSHIFIHESIYYLPAWHSTAATQKNMTLSMASMSKDPV